MATDLSAEFEAHIASVRAGLESISEERANQAPSGRWTRKQVLGHLIDSALNNHLRFVRASLDGSFTGPGYEQERWVELHGYADMPWAELVRQWRVRNELLSRVVARIPEGALGAECRIGEYPVMSLEALIRDYLRHLNHHAAQLLG